MMPAKPTSPTSPARAAQMPVSRLGFHYFPDTLHYRESDLQTWLPELKELGAGWLVLRSETGRAIPEPFLRGLVSAGIEPLVQFPLSPDEIPDLKETQTLFDVYARWGARYLVAFDRPNDRSAWQSCGWAQQDLVERFLDRYLAVASLALQSGLIPVFPPLEPGGSYWDTAFLRSALEALQRRKQEALLRSLVLSAYAWRGPVAASTESSAPQQSLDWGAGGPERWPQTRPYSTPEGSQDQRGFRIFDWYTAIERSVLHRPCPVILLQAGLPGNPQRLGGQDLHRPADIAAYTSITRLLAGEQTSDPLDETNPLESIPSEVIACNFWLLSAEAGSPYAGHAWLRSEGQPAARVAGPAAKTVRQWRQSAGLQASLLKTAPAGGVANEAPIRHYLLLPGYEWGVSDWYLEVIRPYVKKHRPTIGFSVDEAEQAAWVTVVGNSSSYPEDLLSRLQKAGCRIEQIGGDGTDIASTLAER